MAGKIDPKQLKSAVTVAKGGTGADQSAIAKGGLLVGTAAGTIGIKAVGTDAQVLTADAASAGGVKWAAAAGSLDINGLTAADPALGDELPIYDISAAANRKITLEKLGLLHRYWMGGRLTLTSGLAVTTADVTAAGTIYYAPLIDNQVALYDGTRWNLYTITERSLALTLTNAKLYDVWLYDNAGTVTLELSAAWTNNTTRATALTTQDGVLVKSGAATRRYVGTIYASGTNTTEDSAAKRFVWNCYNRRERALYRFDSTSHTYNVAAYRQWNAAAADQIEWVHGLAEQSMLFIVSATIQAATAAHPGYVSGGLDTTTAISLDLHVRNGYTDQINGCIGKTLYPGLGYHYMAIVEYGEVAAPPTMNGVQITSTVMG